MSIEATIIEDLKRDEGLRLKPYLCTAGRRSIGVGRNFDDNSLTAEELEIIFGRNGITVEDAELLLSNDIKKTRQQLKVLFSDFDEFPDNVKRVLINMHFNLGDAGFRSLRTLIEGVKKKDWKYCATRMKTFSWFKQVGQRAVRLVALMQGA